MPENIKIIIKQSPFFKGMVRVVDLSSMVRKNHNIAYFHNSDIESIAEDWKHVGKDINNAMIEYQKETNHVIAS